MGETRIWPEDVSFQALSVLLDRKEVVLIDVRRPEELHTDGQIPGSVNLPLKDIPEALDLEEEEFLSKYKFSLPDLEAKNIVLTCRSGKRILVAQARMKKRGFNHVRLFRGSINGWKENGGEVNF